MSLQKIYIEKELFDITNFNALFIYESQGGTSDFRLQTSDFKTHTSDSVLTGCVSSSSSYVLVRFTLFSKVMPIWIHFSMKK